MTKRLHKVTMLSDIEIEQRERVLAEQKQAELRTSITFCLGEPKAKAFLKYLLQSMQALEPIPSGLSHDSLVEASSLHRIGNLLLKDLMQVSPELTGQLLIHIEKDNQNEREFTRQQ